MKILKPLKFLPVLLTKEQYDSIHNEYRAHSFHNSYHNHMYVEFGQHDELLILKQAMPEIAKKAMELKCDGVKFCTEE